MEAILYNNDLILRQFSHLKIKDFELHLKSGNFKILVDVVEGKRDRVIIRWPNTRVFGPSHKLVSVLLLELFHGIPDQDIVYQGIYPCGFEITSR